MSLIWKLKEFNQLSLAELYAVLKLRNEVFVIEQKCYFPDLDDIDQKSLHYLGFSKNQFLAAYCRIVPAGISYLNISIGRVIVQKSYRRSGAGMELMINAIEQCRVVYGPAAITIGAQVYLKSFYESLGFKHTGEVYKEDDIDHVEMNYHRATAS